MKDKITTILLENSMQNFQDITLAPVPSTNKSIHNFRLSSPNLENNLNVQVQEQSNAQKSYDCQKKYHEKISSVSTPEALELIHHPLGSILISSIGNDSKNLEEAIDSGEVTKGEVEKVLAELTKEIAELKIDTRPPLASASLLDRITNNSFLSEADKLVLIKRYIEDFTQSLQWNLVVSPSLEQAITYHNGKFYLNDFSQAYYSDHMWLDILISNKSTKIHNNFWANSWPQKSSLLTEICANVLQTKNPSSPIASGNPQLSAEFIQSYVKLLHDRGDMKHKSQITLFSRNQETFGDQKVSCSSLGFNSMKQIHHLSVNDKDLSVNDKEPEALSIQPFDCPGCLTLKKMTLIWSDGSSVDYDYREYTPADFGATQDAFFLPSRHGLAIISTSPTPYFHLKDFKKPGCKLVKVILETAQFTHFIRPEIIRSLLPLLKYNPEQQSIKNLLDQEIAILQDSISDWKFKYNFLLKQTRRSNSIAMRDQLRNNILGKVIKPFRRIYNALQK